MSGPESLMQHLPLGERPARQRQVDCTAPLLSRKGRHFALTGIDTYPGYGFAFSASSTSAQMTSHVLTESLAYHRVFHTALLLAKELTSQEMQ